MWPLEKILLEKHRINAKISFLVTNGANAKMVHNPHFFSPLFSAFIRSNYYSHKHEIHLHKQMHQQGCFFRE